MGLVKPPAYRLMVVCGRTLFAGLTFGAISVLALVVTGSKVMLIPVFASMGLLMISFTTAMIAWVPANRWAVRYLAGSRSARELGRRYVSMQAMLLRDIFTFRKS